MTFSVLSVMATPQPPPGPQVTADKIELNRWRFGETNGFVVKDYTGIEKDSGQEPAVMVLKCSDIFDFIADASARQAKIAIYAIGDRKSVV